MESICAIGAELFGAAMEFGDTYQNCYGFAVGDLLQHVEAWLSHDVVPHIGVRDVCECPSQVSRIGECGKEEGKYDCCAHLDLVQR